MAFVSAGSIWQRYSCNQVMKQWEHTHTTECPLTNILHITVDFCHSSLTIPSFKADRGVSHRGYLSFRPHWGNEWQAQLRPDEPHTTLDQHKMQEIALCSLKRNIVFLCYDTLHHWQLPSSNQCHNEDVSPYREVDANCHISLMYVFQSVHGCRLLLCCKLSILKLDYI